MSGMLITIKDDHAQDFKDDLESTIYVLLWVAIMYSSCSNAAHAAGFLWTVLDPQPYSGTTYTTKPDFLKGRDFFQLVKFPGRPHLNQLLINLAELFSARYKPSSGQDNIDAADALLANVPEAEQSRFIRFVSVLWRKECLKLLNNHEWTLHIFNEALNDRSQWPSNDRVEKQDFGSDDSASHVLMEPMIKTGWDTLIQEHNSI